jgi:two-component system, sensor histidine kinase LadS
VHVTAIPVAPVRGIDLRLRVSMQRMRGLMWLWLWLLVGGPAYAVAAPSLVLERGGGNRVDAAPALRLLRDPEQALDAAQAWQALARDEFVAPPNRLANLGFTRDAVWFHLRIENRDRPQSRWVLAIAQPRLDRIEVRVRDEHGTETSTTLGDSQPFGARSEDHRWPNVTVDLAAGQHVDVLLRVTSDSSIQLPLSVSTPEALYRSTQAEQVGLGLYYGILLALLLYNLAVLLSIRDASYLYYVLYVLAFGVMMLSFNGIGFQYLWPDSPRWQDLALPIGIGALLASTIAFASSFLDLKHRLPRVARLIDIVALLALLLVLAACVGFEYEALIALNIGVMAMGLVVTAAAIACARQGSRPALYFLLAWTLLIAGGVALPLSSFGLLPRTFLTEYSIQFGSAAEMLLLSFSLAHRINLLKSDNERLMRATNEELEQRVGARTAELNAALQRLEDANRQLHDVSRRDGLTGVFNRRHLDQALDQAWQKCRREGLPLSLLLIDIDHFKSINDGHGHVAGDDCLRAVASRLRGGVDDGGETLARYGGEEFVLLLPGVDATVAQTRAESLRCAVADAPVAHEHGSVRITVSIGVSTLRPAAPEALGELLRLGDQALYEAKRRGRDRVVVANA